MFFVFAMTYANLETFGRTPYLVSSSPELLIVLHKLVRTHKTLFIY